MKDLLWRERACREMRILEEVLEQFTRRLDKLNL